MSLKKSISIALAFVGLLVGAGFATGQEVIQYFISFGWIGIIGAVIAGIVMSVAGAAILQLGSYFLADEHNKVFSNISHPVMSKILDTAVTVTLFCVGFVMLAGAGSNIEQQFGIPPWVGAAVMLVLVLITGMFDVDKVSSIISNITPAIIIAVVVAFGYTMFHIPSDFGSVESLSVQQDSPVRPWWLSALNYNGLALLLGVSMSLVIGGNHANPRSAGRGGLWGGLLYTVMLLMAAVTLYFNMAAVGGAAVPMLALFESMHPMLAFIMVWIIFAMIYNTCIGMFYALGRRLTANHPDKFKPVFIGVTVVGFGISFFGFEALMTYVYPAIGYAGMVMVAVLVFWWVKHRKTISEEIKRREQMHQLAYQREHPDEEFTKRDAAELRSIATESNAEPDRLREVFRSEVEEQVSSEVEDYQASGTDGEGSTAASTAGDGGEGDVDKR